MTEKLDTTLPPYVIAGERDWRPKSEWWKGPLKHPYGVEAYCVLEPWHEETRGVRLRIYPSREAALPYIRECGYE